MLSGFFGKGKKPDGSQAKDAVDSRGLEVVEDDPDTTWGLWESAVAEQDSRFSALPVLEPLPDAYGGFLQTVPLPIMEDGLPYQPEQLQMLSVDQRKEAALQIVELHHHRIANTIRSLWGHKECSDYISKLIMSGGDGMGHARIGFNQDAAHAMMVISDMHDKLFGPTAPSGGPGFGDLPVRTGFDSLR
jgi:hypothetical protein